MPKKTPASTPTTAPIATGTPTGTSDTRAATNTSRPKNVAPTGTPIAVQISDSAHETSFSKGRRSLIRQGIDIVGAYRVLVDFDAPIASCDLLELAALVVAIARDRSTLGTDEMGPAGGVATVVGTLGRKRVLDDRGQTGVLVNCLI